MVFVLLTAQLFKATEEPTSYILAIYVQHHVWGEKHDIIWNRATWEWGTEWTDAPLLVCVGSFFVCFFAGAQCHVTRERTCRQKKKHSFFHASVFLITLVLSQGCHTTGALVSSLTPKTRVRDALPAFFLFAHTCTPAYDVIRAQHLLLRLRSPTA